MPLLTQLREGNHPLLFPTDLSVVTTPTIEPSTSQDNNSLNSSLANDDLKPATSVDGDQAEYSGDASLLTAMKHSPSQDNQNNFPCPDCGRMYKLKSSLRNHQKWECGKEPQFQCPFCVYRAKQKMHIGRHMERMHKEKFSKYDNAMKKELEENSAI